MTQMENSGRRSRPRRWLQSEREPRREDRPRVLGMVLAADERHLPRRSCSRPCAAGPSAAGPGRWRAPRYGWRQAVERRALMLPGHETPITRAHWSFGQLTSRLVGAPATHLRQRPAPLAGIRNEPCAVTAHLMQWTSSGESGSSHLQDVCQSA